MHPAARKVSFTSLEHIPQTHVTVQNPKRRRHAPSISRAADPSHRVALTPTLVSQNVTNVTPAGPFRCKSGPVRATWLAKLFDVNWLADNWQDAHRRGTRMAAPGHGGAALQRFPIGHSTPTTVRPHGVSVRAERSASLRACRRGHGPHAPTQEQCLNPTRADLNV